MAEDAPATPIDELDSIVAREHAHADAMTDEQQAELSEAYEARVGELANG